MAAAAQRSKAAGAPHAPGQARPEPATKPVPAASDVSAQGQPAGPEQGEQHIGQGRPMQPGQHEQPRKDRNHRKQRGSGIQAKARKGLAFTVQVPPPLRGRGALPAVQELAAAFRSSFADLCKATVAIVGASQQGRAGHMQSMPQQPMQPKHPKQQQQPAPPRPSGQAAGEAAGSAQAAAHAERMQVHEQTAPNTPLSPIVCSIPAPRIPSSAAPQAPERPAAAVKTAAGAGNPVSMMEVVAASTSGREEPLALTPAEEEELLRSQKVKRQRLWLYQPLYQRMQIMEEFKHELKYGRGSDPHAVQLIARLRDGSWDLDGAADKG